MRFIAVPRQAGKTTIAKNFFNKFKLEKLYFNRDLREVRKKYREDPYFFENLFYDSKRDDQLPLICLNEIHRASKWKNILKDYFDKSETLCRFIITGNTGLNWFKKSGDSLASRYFLFKLFPLSL